MLWLDTSPWEGSKHSLQQEWIPVQTVKIWWVPPTSSLPHTVSWWPTSTDPTLWQTWVVTHHSSETHCIPIPTGAASTSPAAGTHLWELRRGRLCWWCSCHFPLVHGWVSRGTGGMSFIDRNCIINLDRILTLSWHAIFSSSQKAFRKQVTWNMKL